LVGFGNAGDFGRFRAYSPVPYRRGDRVVLHTANGAEAGVVMCPATDSLDPFLAPQPLGELLRYQSADDERDAENMRQLGEALLEDARHLAEKLNLPLQFIDVEITLDGGRATLSYLRPHECDYRPLVSSLSKQYDILIGMQNLTLTIPPDVHGCGRPDCGKGEGGCSTCGSGGGCATGCGSGMKKEQVAAQLAALAIPNGDVARTPLL
jgi:hypothetical protein